MGTIASSPKRYALGAWTLGAYPLAGEGADLPSAFPGTQPGELMVVEIAKGEAPFTPGAAQWTAYTDRVLALSITRGRATEVGTYPAGQCSITLDSADRELDPFDDTEIIPNMPVRVRVIADGNTRQLFYGFVDSVNNGFDWPELADVTLVCSDALKYLARHELTEDTYGDAGTDDEPDEIVGLVLDDFGWPAGDRDIDTGVRTVETFTYAGNALALVDKVTQVEGPTACRFVNRTGDFDWRARRAITNDTSSTTSQITFSNIATDTGVVRFTNVIAGIDESAVFNRAVVTRDSNSFEGTDSDATSISANGPLSIGLAGPYASDANCTTDAEVLVELFKNPKARIAGLTLTTCTDDATFDTLVQLDLRDRVTVKVEHPGGGTDISVELIIEAITYTVAKDASGSRFGATYTFGSADRYDDLVTALGASY